MEQMLGPYSTTTVAVDGKLADMATNGTKLVNLEIETEAEIGALVGALTQRDSSDIVEDIPFRTSNPPAFDRGSYPLRWTGDYTNQVAIANTSSKPLGYRAIITAGEQIYVLPKGTVAPNATKVFDVDEIRRQGTPDVNGQRLPADAPYGKFLWSEMSDGRNSGLLGRTSLASNSDHRRSSFSCGEQCDNSDDFYPVMGVNIYGDPMSTEVNYGSYNVGVVSETYQSTNQPFYHYPYPYAGFQWSLPDSSVIGISADPNSTSSFDLAGTGVGSTELTWTTYDFYTYDFVGGSTCVTQETDGTGYSPESSAPVVSITGPGAVLLSSAGGVNATIQLAASGNPTGGSYSWTSSNSNVTLTNQTTDTVAIAGTNVGQSILTVTYTLNGQTGTATKNVTVQMPGSISSITDTGNVANACYATPGHVFVYNGATREVGYQLKDTTGAPIQIANIPMAESFSMILDGCGYGSPPTPVNGPTSASGRFIDSFATTCISACDPHDPSYTPSCSTTMNHVWTANGITVFSKTLAYGCATIAP